jgi:hypothetical protein
MAKITAEFFHKYLDVAMMEEQGPLLKLIKAAGYPETDTPCDVDFDMMLWAMVNEPNTAMAFWQMSGEELSENLNLYADDIQLAQSNRA